MRYSILRDYLMAFLLGREWDPMPTFVPGPGTDDNALDVSPDRLVMLTFGSGAGLSTEQAFDRPIVQIRAAGNQSDYDDGERLAYDLDRGMVAVDSSRSIGGVWVASFNRTGGNPQLLLWDDADRANFTCTYIMESETGYDN